jgi:hypothetical protein
MYCIACVFLISWESKYRNWVLQQKNGNLSCNNSIAIKSILLFEVRMRKRKILRSFLSRQKYKNLFQYKVMPILKFLPIEMLML